MTEDGHESIRRLYEEYGRSFSGLDPDASVAYWHAPSIRVSPDGVRLDATAAERRDGFVAAIEALGTTAYDHSEAMAVRAHALSGSLALSNVVWHRLTDDGDVLSRFAPLHLLTRTDEGWRFLARSSRRSDDPVTMRSVADEAADGGQAPAAIEAFFEEYARALSTRDGGEIAAHWHHPALDVSPDGVRALTSAAAVAALFDPADGTDQRDGGRTEATAVYAHELDDSAALADVRWRRYPAGGTVLDRAATVHLLTETDDGWRLVLNARHPPETLVSLGD